MRPRMRIEQKDPDTIRVLGKDLRKTSLFFIAQVIAFWLMIFGMVLFVIIWYVQNT